MGKTEHLVVRGRQDESRPGGRVCWSQPRGRHRCANGTHTPPKTALLLARRQANVGLKVYLSTSQMGQVFLIEFVRGMEWPLSIGALFCSKHARPAGTFHPRVCGCVATEQALILPYALFSLPMTIPLSGASHPIRRCLWRPLAGSSDADGEALGTLPAQKKRPLCPCVGLPARELRARKAVGGRR